MTWSRLAHSTRCCSLSPRTLYSIPEMLCPIPWSGVPCSLKQCALSWKCQALSPGYYSRPMGCLALCPECSVLCPGKLSPLPEELCPVPQGAEPCPPSHCALSPRHCSLSSGELSPVPEDAESHLRVTELCPLRCCRSRSPYATRGFLPPELPGPGSSRSECRIRRFLPRPRWAPPAPSPEPQAAAIPLLFGSDAGP